MVTTHLTSSSHLGTLWTFVCIILHFGVQDALTLTGHYLVSALVYRGIDRPELLGNMAKIGEAGAAH
ncbi:hypothetical protein MN608_00382 [Microdochium nivale]|nr:hypothetical protein MN608_00382 [Microdochium nivale]